MTDWTAAGRKAWATRQANEAARREAAALADAHHVRDLYRDGFSSRAQDTARRRSIEALIAAGGTVCLDLWGGGRSAEELVSAGFRVISVEDGSMVIKEPDGRVVTAERKRRALERCAHEGGYEARWGSAATHAHEADVALLDFCGPLVTTPIRTVEACRHMKAIVVKAMTDHDVLTGAVGQRYRRVMYEATLRVAFGSHRCRRLCVYKRDGGQPVWVYLLTREPIGLARLSAKQSLDLDPERRARVNAYHRVTGRALYAKVPLEVRRERQRRANEYKAQRAATDPEYAAHLREIARQSAARRRADPETRAKLNSYQRERKARIATDPVARAERNAKARESYARRNARRDEAGQ